MARKRILMKKCLVILISVLTCTVFAGGKPNVILILADDMGMEAVSAYGSQTYKTPNLDALAARGVRFDNCTSTPICTPSRVKIMTGQHTFHNYRGFGTYPIGSKTIGDLMKEAGYATACYGKWQLAGGYPTGTGFDEYLCANGGVPGIKGDRYWEGKYGDHHQKSVRFSARPDYVKGDGKPFGPDLLRYQVNDFISRQVKADKPFFVYYPMVLVHWPFVRTPDTIGDGHHRDGTPQDDFAAMVAYADKIVGQILAHLDSLGQRDNTLIIFTGDNGTYPGLTGILADGTKWEGAKSTPIRPGQHVPLIAVFGKGGKARVSNEVVDFTDILPTLADAADSSADLEREYNCFGRSILPTITGEGKTAEKKYTLSWYPSIVDRPYSEALFVSDGTWKLYPGDLLFQIKEDPFENKPIYPYADTAESKAARAGLAAYLQQCIDRWPKLKANVEAEPRIIATWKNDDIPEKDAAELSWDITPHLTQQAGFEPGEFAIEVAAYYGFSRLNISGMEIWHEGQKVAESDPSTGFTRFSRKEKGGYQYEQVTTDNLFKFKLDQVDAGTYTLKATLKRAAVKNTGGLKSQSNGYFYLFSGSDWMKKRAANMVSAPTAKSEEIAAKKKDRSRKKK